MQNLKAWFDAKRREIVFRLAGDDAQKILRVYAIAIFVAGVASGCLLIAFARFPAMLILMIFAGAVGYAARSFVSYRRRQAARRLRM